MAAPLTSKPLVSDFSSSVSHIPSTYVRPISDRPKLSQAETSGDTIPLIDLRDLHGPNRAEIMRQIAHACSTHGFFQVTPV
uniref:Non-haem dioxygenase N-terminal domain-containing protein n=1 Tax=Brassica oleracea var. oleracea TaxID=109376 RepID=A0A0D3B806_BRAOL